MSRQMDEIPDDVMKAARECAGNVLLAAGSKLGHYEGYTQTAIVKAAARAILAEREWCASVCRGRSVHAKAIAGEFDVATPEKAKFLAASKEALECAEAIEGAK